MIEIIPAGNKIDIKSAVPTSKSYTNRALLLAALAKGKSKIINPLESEDTELMVKALKKLGVTIKKTSQAFIVTGTEGTFKKPKSPLYLGNAGTAVRFLTAALATQEFESRITGSERMCKRPISDLTEALKSLGAKIKSNRGRLPLTIKGPLKGKKTQIKGSISSQYLSALLMTAPYTKTPVQISVKGKLTSLPYFNMTLDIIGKFGGKIKNNRDRIFEINPHRYKAAEYVVEGDASSASYPLAIAALNGGKALITNIPARSKQADMQFLNVLKKMGCKVRTVKSGKNAVKQISGPKNLTPPGTAYLSNMPDAAMTAAILCAFTKGKSRLTGLGTLRVKECDRLEALEKELKKTGVKVKTGKTYIEIDGDPLRLHGAEIETYNDHRMAMCFAVAGSKIKGIKIKNPQCVRKTYPTFFADLKKWGIMWRKV